MEYVRFGSTGLKVSRICLGCMSYRKPTALSSVECACLIAFGAILCIAPGNCRGNPGH
jgi:hypothetical protein